jgi:hypothetical protein
MTLPYVYPNTIVINDGIVMASSKPINYHQSPSEAAGIGGGYSGPGGDITINGGIVVAYSEDGAGIGSGRLGYVPRVEINGGSVVALAMLGGAGIGGGRQGETGYVFINGGEVMAIGGAHEFISDAIYGPLTSLNVSSFIVDLIGRFLLSLRGGAYIDPTNTIYTVFQEIAEIIILLNQRFREMSDCLRLLLMKCPLRCMIPNVPDARLTGISQKKLKRCSEIRNNNKRY